jgi:hypothetical protein
MGARLAYLDTLKVLLVLGVIAMHSAITYGLDGSWYLESYDEMSGAVVDLVTAVLGVGWLFGLAFALQPIPAPAEVKFLALLVAGVAGSFSVTAVVQSVAPFRHTRPTLRPASSRRSARPRGIRMRDTEARREASRPIRSP